METETAFSTNEKLSARDDFQLTRDDVATVESQLKNGKSRIRFATSPDAPCNRAVNPERNYKRIVTDK